MCNFEKINYSCHVFVLKNISYFTDRVPGGLFNKKILIDKLLVETMMAYGMQFAKDPSGPKNQELESQLAIMVADASAAYAMKQSLKHGGKYVQQAQTKMAIFFRTEQIMGMKKLGPSEWANLVMAAMKEGPMTLSCFKLQQEYERLNILLEDDESKQKKLMQKSLDVWKCTDTPEDFSAYVSDLLPEARAAIDRHHEKRWKARNGQSLYNPVHRPASRRMARPTTPRKQVVPTEADFPPLPMASITKVTRPATKPMVKVTPQVKPMSINGIPIRYETSSRRKGRKGRRKKKK